ncbi:MAG: FtsX-like permease family protein [Janthinobacterium lividum]
MLFHGFLTFYRSVSRQRLYTTLNLLSLATGIAVFLLLITIVSYENGYNRWIPDADHIYRIDTTWTFPGQLPSEGAGSSFLALDLLREDFPQIRAGTRHLERRFTITTGNIVGSDYLSLVDPNFLDVMKLPLVLGSRSTALSSPSSVVLSQASARKYFGTEDVIGRSLVLSEGTLKRTVIVTAVFRDLPPDSTLHFSLLAPFTPASEAAYPWLRLWDSENGETYLRFDSATAAASVSRNLQDFVTRRITDKNVGNYRVLSLVRLTDLHFHDLAVIGAEPGVDRHIIESLGVIGVLTLLIAAINYVNLATARAALRAREVALRKVMGATPAMLLVQFMGEAVLMVMVSSVIGLALVELAVPLVNALGGWSVRVDYRRMLPLLALVVVVVGVGAGSYPAVMLARYEPAAVLAASRSPSGGRGGTRLRASLVLLQFATAISFAICTLVIDGQAAFLRSADRGFEPEGLVLVLSTSIAQLTSRQPQILDQIRHVAGVVAATASDSVPNGGSISLIGVKRPGLPGQQPSLIYQRVSDNYFGTYGIPLLAGRVFDSAHGTDDAAHVAAGTASVAAQLSTIISRKAVSSLGYSSPSAALGQHFNLDHDGRKEELTIVGVVDDVRFTSPREAVSPQFYVEATSGIENAPIVVRFSGVSRAVMMQRLQAVWKRLAPDEPFRAQSVDDRLAAFYRPDQQRARLFSAGAVLAIAIACVGLYGLASFNTARRVREIGIRKVLGASTRDVLLLLVGQFIRPVLIANVIAWPIAWVAMRGWLSGFDQRIALSPAYFVAATVAALAISIFTVLGQAWRVARAEPGRALRYE